MLTCSRLFVTLHTTGGVGTYVYLVHRRSPLACTLSSDGLYSTSTSNKTAVAVLSEGSTRSVVFAVQSILRSLTYSHSRLASRWAEFFFVLTYYLL